MSHQKKPKRLKSLSHESGLELNPIRFINIESSRGWKQCTVSVLILLSLQSGEKLDKIELAFRKFDKNQDGFLSKEEFDVVSFLT